MEDMDSHYRALESMYLAAPINRFYKPTIQVKKELAEIEIEVNESFFHAARAVHGSVYFKLLDDAAFFAANSVEGEFFVLTVSFGVDLTRPISSGRMRAEGRFVQQSGRKILAESVVYDDQGGEIGYGKGTFVVGKTPLADAMGYSFE